jgi:hypothetical protein
MEKETGNGVTAPMPTPMPTPMPMHMCVPCETSVDGSEVGPTNHTLLPEVNIQPEDYENAILFLEMKGKMQEMRISELESMVRRLACDVEMLKKTPKIDTQNNTTNNINLMVQMNVDRDKKLGVLSGMERAPGLPDTVREQMEQILPVTIQALFAKNDREIEEGDDEDKIVQYMELGDEPDDVDPDPYPDESDSMLTEEIVEAMMQDEGIREAMRKVMMGEGGSLEEVQEMVERLKRDIGANSGGSEPISSV